MDEMFSKDLETIRDKELETILTAYPNLEKSIIKCSDLCSKQTLFPSEDQIKAKFMEQIGLECQDEIANIRTSVDESSITDSHISMLTEFLLDGINLFSPIEQSVLI